MSENISVVIHTYNNEKIIRECLNSVKDFDEIVICDMYSTDKTLEIAKEYNTKIVMHDNTGYVEPARNFAIQQASNEWVLVVDSDEVITKELREYLYNFIKNPQNTTALKIPRKNYFMDKMMYIKYPDYILRFFKKDLIYWPPYVHATPTIKSGQIAFIDKNKIELAIVHLQNRNISQILDIINKYTDLEVEKMINEKKKFRPFYSIYKSCWIILEKFFLKGGYKDGIRGLIFSILCYGVYNFCACFKYWEYLQKSSQREHDEL